MVKNKTLSDYEKLIHECVKCGVCMAHCPTYRENRREGDVARGKIALAASLLEGKASLDERLQQHVSMCLMCGSCVHKCPNKVPTDEIVGAIRRQVSTEQGLSPIGKSVSTVISSKPLMKTLTKAGSLLSPLVLKKIPHTSGLRLRFPLTNMKDRTLPHIGFRNLFDIIPEFTEGKPEKPVLGFFAGCAITYIYPDLGRAMVSLLNNMGFSVYFPHGQKCCGIPALSTGAGRVIEELAENNIHSFEKYNVETIITACASCNGGIHEYYSTMKNIPRNFTDRVMDFSVFLSGQGVVEELMGMKRWDNPSRVAYHDPCHLKKQGVTEEPRDLLKALPNVDFVEMVGASLCCGLGGTFSVNHYECSRAIGAKKVSGLTECEAEVVATSCPGCVMQLQDIINHAGLSVRAVHVLELMSEAYTKRDSSIS